MVSKAVFAAAGIAQSYCSFLKKLQPLQKKLRIAVAQAQIRVEVPVLALAQVVLLGLEIQSGATGGNVTVTVDNVISAINSNKNTNTLTAQQKCNPYCYAKIYAATGTADLL